MDRAECEERLAAARSGHLATVRPDGRPHLVVVTFATYGDRIVTAIDHKPKSTQRLQRLVNIEADPNVSFLVDGYDEDWARLWWVRVDGGAGIWVDGVEWHEAIDALVVRYDQYRERRPEGPVIAIEPSEITGWASRE